MPPAKRGLGQGLEALVSGNHQPRPALSLPSPPPVPPPPARWEYACIERLRGRRRRSRIWFSTADGSRIVRPRPAPLARLSLWAAIGLLGEEGWELVGLRGGRRFYFKRPVLSTASVSENTSNGS